MAIGRSLVANVLSSPQERVGRGAEFVDLLLIGRQWDVAAPGARDEEPLISWRNDRMARLSLPVGQ